jgi:hypothetical protein
MPVRYLGAPKRFGASSSAAGYRHRVIPLPRAWLLTSAMLIGAAVGLIGGVLGTVLVTATVRPDVVIALVVGVPSILGLTMIVFSGRRWVTTTGAFLLAIAPGWLGALALVDVVSGG